MFCLYVVVEKMILRLIEARRSTKHFIAKQHFIEAKFTYLGSVYAVKLIDGIG